MKKNRKKEIKRIHNTARNRWEITIGEEGTIHIEPWTDAIIDFVPGKDMLKKVFKGGPYCG